MSEQTVKCALCRTPAPLKSKNPYFPFCSAKCKQIDFGKWLNEDYHLSTTQDGTERSLRPEQHFNEEEL